MTYLIQGMNNMNQALESQSMLEQVNQVITIAKSLLALVVIIIGLNWVKPLKEKQNTASFTFWSQIYIRLIKINTYIKSNEMCLVYWYSPKARKEWQSILAPKPDEFLQLRMMVEETLTFLQGANDQMPPYLGWTEDYTNLLSYFTDMIVYDICFSDGKFKFEESIDYQNYLNMHQSICTLINTVCSNVKGKQKSIEYRLTVVWYRRLGEWFIKHIFKWLQKEDSKS